jgi:hypothetical protein
MTLFKNKFYALIMLLFAAAGAVFAAEFQAVLEPSAVMEGEPFTLQLITRGSTRAEVQELPKNFTYQGSSQSTQIINGDRTNMVGYQFTAPAPGNYKLPPLKVKMGKKVLTTPELTLQVVKDTAAALGVEELFARAVLGIDRKKSLCGRRYTFVYQCILSAENPFAAWLSGCGCR